MSETEQFKCLIWGTPAELDQMDFGGGDEDCIVSARAGGMYRVSKTFEKDFINLNLPPQNKVALSYWIKQQLNSSEVEIPLIDENIVLEFLHRIQRKVANRIDDAILWFSNKQESLADWVEIIHPGMVSENDKRIKIFFDFLASTSCVSTDDGLFLLQFMVEEKYLEKQNSVPNYRLTYNGWKREGDLTGTDSLTSTAFVAMWFSTSMDSAYSDGFKLGIEDAGYEVVRIDRKQHNNKIDDEIISEIRRCKFVVADFTSELVNRKRQDGTNYIDTHARGGVYFEAGLAKGLGKEVIWCAKSDVIDANVLHFDTRQFAHIRWSDESDLRQQLSQRITSTLGFGPNYRSKSD